MAVSRRFVSNPFRERHGPGETAGCRIRPPPGGPRACLQQTPQIPRGTRATAVQKARRGVQGLTPDGGAGKRLPGGVGVVFWGQAGRYAQGDERVPGTDSARPVGDCGGVALWAWAGPGGALRTRQGNRVDKRVRAAPAASTRGTSPPRISSLSLPSPRLLFKS